MPWHATSQPPLAVGSTGITRALGPWPSATFCAHRPPPTCRLRPCGASSASTARLPILRLEWARRPRTMDDCSLGTSAQVQVDDGVQVNSPQMCDSGCPLRVWLQRQDPKQQRTHRRAA